ncbi:MAG: guanylate kinase [Calditrichaeota bacterium]|nr:guanylate kinase [Calditrichota bacterium]RQW08528.1 MAG: guanylate kinase [Calditrichota bacterium]
MKRKTTQSQLVVLSSPSGGGKTTIARALVGRKDEYQISISATTRAPRQHEQDGVDYYFMSEGEFAEKVEKGEFLEYEQVHGNFYGTLKSEVNRLLAHGYTVIFDIDVYGALSIKKRYPRAILIFIRPPSLYELKRRLSKRKTENPATIQKRLERLPEEYEKARYFDYDITNDKLKSTIEQIIKIIEKHQQKESHVSDRTIQE